MSFKTFIGSYARLWLDKIRDQVAHACPYVCVLCLDPCPSCYICQDCQQMLPILAHCCKQCARFLPLGTPDSLICGQCLSSPPPFDHTDALFSYQPPIIQMIIQLKFQHQLHFANALAQQLILSITQKWYASRPLPDVIIPMPLHAKRLQERGFNQALEIIKPVAKALALPIDTRGITRSKPTLAQSKLKALARKQNMAGAFTAYRNYSGLSIAVFDDVITTGHTMLEFCQVLKQQGASRIDVWCCARVER